MKRLALAAVILSLLPLVAAAGPSCDELRREHEDAAHRLMAGERAATEAGDMEKLRKLRAERKALFELFFFSGEGDEAKCREHLPRALRAGR